MRYTSKFFKEEMPEWKRKKDPILSRFFYRKIAFRTAAFAANAGISANSVSYFSIIIGIVSFGLCRLFRVEEFSVLERIGRKLFGRFLPKKRGKHAR